MKDEPDSRQKAEGPKISALDSQKEHRRRIALERMARLNWTLPPDFKFDRDEANER